MPSHPIPEQAKIDKVVKEWQVGRHRVQQIVHWLCEPFSVPKIDLAPVALMPAIPRLDNLKPGDMVSGVVVGVARFGVFVELGPDCSGLIHVSRMSKGFVEDPHEVVQVGDVVNAYVTAIESGRRRVALSVMSPAEEQMAAQARAQRDAERGGRGNRSGQSPRGGQRAATSPNAQGRPASAPGEPRRGSATGASGGPGQRASSGGRGKPTERSGQAGGRGNAAGGRGREGGRGGRSRDGGGRGRDAQPRTFTVTSSKEPPKKISDSMKSGEEPLRSFGALMQFYQEKTEPPKADSSQSPVAELDSSGSAVAGSEGTSVAAGQESVQQVSNDVSKPDDESSKTQSSQSGEASSEHVDAGAGKENG